MQIYPPGTMIGPYEITILPPKQGGMGVVYFCLDHNNDRPVALKTFKPEFLPDRAARDRFLREGTAWVELGHHPHIVRCYEVQYIDPTAYLALELIAKEQGMDDASLRPWLGQPMPLQQALLFTLQIARGLAYANARIPGFVHRDLKPENVLVGADKLPGTSVNRLRVTDFGLAAIFGGSGDAPGEASPNPRRAQLTHGLAGTPLYMAPEQWQGQAVGAYTDIYALGCILSEMLTGRFAVSGHSQTELQAAHCTGRLNPLPADLPPALRDLLSRTLALRPTERYPTWAEMIRALEAAYTALGAGSVPEVEAAQAESLEERQQAGWSYNAIGLAYKDLGKAEVAAGYFEKALHLARETGNRHGEGAALGHLGLAYARLGDARRALGYYEQCLVILREIGDRRGEGAILGNLGNAYAALGDARRAIGYYEQRMVIARETGDRSGEGATLSNLGNAYADLGDARRALGYYEQCLVILREIGDRRGEGAALGNLGLAYADLGDARRAIGYYEQYLAITREIGDRRGEGNALNNLGSAYADLGDARRAIGYYEQQIEITREIGNRHGEGAALNNIGEAYRNLGDARQAIGYYEQSLIIKREIGDRRGEGAALGNLGNAYADLGDARRAIGYYEQDLVIAREIGDRRGEGNVLGNLGSAYKNLGDARRAIEYTHEALQISREIGDIVTAGMFGANLGMSLAQAGNISEAIPLVKQAIQDFYRAGYPHHAQKAEGMLAQLQDGGEAPPPDPTQAAFEAFQRAGSPQAMQTAVAQHPLLKDAQFIQTIERMIVNQIPLEQKPAFEQRMGWLKQITGKQRAGFFNRLFGKKG